MPGGRGCGRRPAPSASASAARRRRASSASACSCAEAAQSSASACARVCGQDFRALGQRGPPHLVHLPVDLGARRRRLLLELGGRFAGLRGRSLGQLARRPGRLLALVHDALQRPEQQPVQQDRQHEHEENDPEDRQIRKQHHLPAAQHHPSGGGLLRQTNINLYHGTGSTVRRPRGFGICACVASVGRKAARGDPDFEQPRLQPELERRLPQDQQRFLRWRTRRLTASRVRWPSRPSDAAEACAASTLTSRPPEVWGSWNRCDEIRIDLGREANIGTEVRGVGPAAARERCPGPATPRPSISGTAAASISSVHPAGGGHLGRVADQAEAGDVGAGVHGSGRQRAAAPRWRRG